jgi:hypothetical protein
MTVEHTKAVALAESLKNLQASVDNARAQADGIIATAVAQQRALVDPLLVAIQEQAKVLAAVLEPPPIEPPPIEPPPIEPPPIEPPPIEPPWQPPRTKSGLPWRSGAFGGNTTALAAARQRPFDYILDFFGEATIKASRYAEWKDNPCVTTGLRRAVAANLGIALAIPLMGDAHRGNFLAVANGELDWVHRQLAQSILANADGKLVDIRLGHEANDGRYPWHYASTTPGEAKADPATYRAAWWRISRIYQRALGNKVRMVWNQVFKHQAVANRQLAAFYPGDDVVDIVSLDLYDTGNSGNFFNNDANWTKALGWYNPATGEACGLDGILQFALAHNKLFACDEWGPMNTSKSASHGSNNSYFIWHMYRWFEKNARHLAFECLFHMTSPGHQLFPPVDYSTRAAAEYVASWAPKVATS